MRKKISGSAVIPGLPKLSAKDLRILRYSVPEYIKNNIELMNLIIEFKEANIQEGGEGAFYIFLKKKKL